MGSPFEIGLYLQSALLGGSAAWVFFQVIRGIVLLPGEFEKQQLEIAKLHDERVERLNKATQVFLEESRGIEVPRRRSSEEREVEVKLVRRDIERISEHKVIVAGIEVRKSIKRRQ
jgi:hypothetical protein